MKKYLLALFTPSGRLPALDYALTVVPLAFLTLFLHHKLNGGEEPPSQYAQIALLVPLWMKFCLTSRRLQDMNYMGFLCFPLFAALAIRFIMDANPGEIDEESSASILLAISEQASRIAMMMAVGCGGLIFGESSPGPNNFGPPFDMPAARKKQSDAAPSGIDRLKPTERRRQTYEDASVNTADRRPPATPGQRQGFGRR